MSDPIIAALIVAIGQITVAILTMIEARKTRQRVADVHELINSGLSRQIDTAAGKAHAEGVIFGTEIERQREESK